MESYLIIFKKIRLIDLSFELFLMDQNPCSGSKINYSFIKNSGHDFTGDAGVGYINIVDRGLRYGGKEVQREMD